MLKSLPSIEQVMEYPEAEKLCEAYSRDLVVGWARAAVDELRAELQAGAEFPVGEGGKVDAEVVAGKMQEMAEGLVAKSLKSVVNATGVVIHTNLGRSPLSPYLIDAIKDLLGSYANLEYDVEEGKRGSRHSHLAGLIRAVTGAEDGFVVNNNAAAVLVAIAALAKGREVVISRGELIEIGGSFRMPEIIESGGATIREVGTTNKTRIDDYRRAIGPDTALLLKVHPSNYKVIGFTEEASIKQVVELGARHGVPVMVDMGSGVLIDLKEHGIDGEPPVGWYIEQGADVVTFSGDKMLGGPQAGFIVGRASVVDTIKKHPMVRALRVGKLTIATLEALLTAYLSPETPTSRVPTLRLLTRPPTRVLAIAKRLARELRKRMPAAEITVEPDEAFAGGGSLPTVPLPTYVVTIDLPGMAAEDLARAFRSAEVPVIGRIGNGTFRLDCRTLSPPEYSLIYRAANAIPVPE